MRRRVSLWLLAFGLGVALLLPAASASPHSESKRGGILRLMWGQEPDSLDPALANGDVGSWALLSATCARLFTGFNDPDSGKPRVVPEVVRSSTRSNGGRTYTFELKRTFRFHTGDRVTARSFADAFHRNANPLMHSPATLYMRDIVGFDAVIQGQAEEVSGVQALGLYRLRIHLKRRAGDFVARLTMPYFCPILPGTPPERIDDPPGSGRYWLADRVPGRQIVLERNPFYRGGRTAYPDRILWTIEPDRSARLRATEQGENDFMLLFGIPNAVVRELVDEYGLNRPGGQVFRPIRRSMSTYPLFKLAFRFNPHRPAFKGAGQAPLRKAINYIIDRPALARARYLAARRSDRLLPAVLSESRRLYPLVGTDPVAARKWLARAGRRPPALTLYTTNFSFAVEAAQVFAFNLRQLGIRVDVREFDFQALGEKLNTRGEPWDVAEAGWSAGYPDPAGVFLPLLRGTRYEARAHAINRVVNDTARAKAWADLEADLMSNDPPVAAYADWTPLFFVSRSFGCWRPGQWVDFAAICKKERD
jgi:oligopeptide transport system substrate-binding protein